MRHSVDAELQACCGAVLNAHVSWGAGRLWTQSLLPAIYTALVAGAATMVSGLLMLSTLAGDELRDVLAATLLSVGSSVSGCAHVMLFPIILFAVSLALELRESEIITRRMPCFPCQERKSSIMCMGIERERLFIGMTMLPASSFHRTCL